MDIKILNEINRNLRLMNINESKIILNEANLGPELEAIFLKLTPQDGITILGKLKLTFPGEAVLNSADKALTKIVKFMGTDLTKLESVLEIAIAENIITKQIENSLGKEPEIIYEDWITSIQPYCFQGGIGYKIQYSKIQ